MTTAACAADRLLTALRKSLARLQLAYDSVDWIAGNVSVPNICLLDLRALDDQEIMQRSMVASLENDNRKGVHGLVLVAIILEKKGAAQ